MEDLDIVPLWPAESVVFSRKPQNFLFRRILADIRDDHRSSCSGFRGPLLFLDVIPAVDPDLPFSMTLGTRPGRLFRPVPAAKRDILFFLG